MEQMISLELAGRRPRSPATRWWWSSLSPGTIYCFAGLLLAAVLLRFVAMASVPLVPEEAYYWMYAQHPNLSYFDHPPMIAWVIGLGTAVFGNSEFGVRVIGCALMLAATWLMYWFGREWHGRPA